MKSNSFQFCTFSLGEHLFGIDIQDVREIKDDFTITPVHHAPKEIKGLSNIRGQVYLALNLRVILQISQNSSKLDKQLILLKNKSGQDLLGILVEMHKGVAHVDEKKIEYHQFDQSIPTDMSLKRNLIVGVCKLQSNLMTILNVENLMSLIET